MEARRFQGAPLTATHTHLLPFAMTGCNIQPLHICLATPSANQGMKILQDGPASNLRWQSTSVRLHGASLTYYRLPRDPAGESCMCREACAKQRTTAKSVNVPLRPWLPVNVQRSQLARLTALGWALPL